MPATRLTEAQFAMLDRICRTNGGGISPYEVDGTQWRVVKRLEALELVQGKKGMEWVAVHTRDGLLLWRSLTNEAPRG